MNPIHFLRSRKITIDKETRFVGHSLPNGEEIPITFDEMKDFFQMKMMNNIKNDGKQYKEKGQ